jgi:enoyl-CoA hydratase
MDHAFECAAEDDEVRVVILSGEGEHFSAGHDLGTPEEETDRKERGFPTEGRGIYKRMRQIYMENTMRWRNLQKPTIAMVHGYCIFGGWMIASAMDVIFASEDALFLPSQFQYFSAPWDLGPRKAKEILFEHRFITAGEALDRHFINRIYPRDELEEETLAYASRVAENDPFTVRSAKFSINHMMDTMGFTAEVEASFQTYFIRRYFEWSEFKGMDYEGRNLADAKKALKHLKMTKGQL